MALALWCHTVAQSDHLSHRGAVSGRGFFACQAINDGLFERRHFLVRTIWATTSITPGPVQSMSKCLPAPRGVSGSVFWPGLAIWYRGGRPTVIPAGPRAHTLCRRLSLTSECICSKIETTGTTACKEPPREDRSGFGERLGKVRVLNSGR